MDYALLKNYFDQVNNDYKKADYLSLIKSELNKYKDLAIKELPNYTELIVQECEFIVEIISKYENGNIFDSFETVNELMQLLYTHIELILIDKKTPEKFLNKNFYRMRESNEQLTERKEIFHVPFNLRRKINTQRYSIPGLPCLYLSSSVYTCWKEMNKPIIQNLFVSKFELNDQSMLKILNFSMVDPKRLFYKDKEHEFRGDSLMYIERLSSEMKIAALVLWPLIYSCSIKGSSTYDYYKPEYIIPQLILQWVRKNDNINGIAYLSIDLDSKNIDPYLCINYVFPAIDTSDEICSYLNNIFLLTDPIRCDVIQNDMMGFHSVSPSLSHRKFGKRQILYEYTIYGIIEQYLQMCDIDKSCYTNRV